MTTITAKIKDHYNDLARKGIDYIQYRWGDLEIKRRHYRQTEAALSFGLQRVGQLGKVLEVGAGPAVWTEMYLSRIEHVTLLDISEEMLRKARERLGAQDTVSYLCGDFVRFPFREGATYDTVISVRAFEYMENKQISLETCYRILKPNGHLLLISKNRGWRDFGAGLSREDDGAGGVAPPDSMHRGVMDWRDVLKGLRQAGFDAAEAYPAVLGSYRGIMKRKVGLLFCDRLHKYLHHRPISRLYDSLVESYLIVAQK